MGNSIINFPKITYHVFVCDSENCMEKLFGNYFFGKSHVRYMKYFFFWGGGINIAIMSGLSVSPSHRSSTESFTKCSLSHTHTRILVAHSNAIGDAISATPLL